MTSPQHAALLQGTPRLADVDLSRYGAALLVGGQGPMYTFMDNADVHGTMRTMLEAGRPTAVVCHATCALLSATGSDGELLVRGKTWTGFANSEERYADEYAGQKIQPFWIEDEARTLPNTNFVVHSMFTPSAVRDGLLITGQQQYSGAAAAELVVEALGV